MLIDFSSATLQILFGLILLSLYHPFFILFSFVLVLLVAAIIRFTAQKGLTTSLSESKYKYRIAHWLEELARTNITFKLSGESDIPLKRTNERVEGYLKSRESHFNVLVQQYTLMILFKILIATGLLAIGGVLVFEQQMNIGQFVGAEIIILIVLSSVEKLIMSMETIYDVLTGLEKIGQLTDMELEKRTGTRIEEEQCPEGLQLDLENITFSYPGHGVETIKDLNLKVKPGEKLMITGANSSGKSTLLSILIGMYDAQNGHLSFNDLPKGNIDLNQLRLLTGNCVDSEQLFEGTLLENISLGRPSATFDNVKWAAKNMGLLEFVRQQPEGFDTMLDPEGRRLPSSVIQKIILARSIAHRPKLLLLKDAFRHLVQPERNEIIDFMTSKENKWTLIAVSSDVHMAKKCDRIALMDKGSIAQEGTFKEMKDELTFKKITHA